MKALLIAGLMLAAAGPSPDTAAPEPARPRLRDLGVTPGIFPPGALNAITDVAGVRVGHRTLIQGADFILFVFQHR